MYYYMEASHDFEFTKVQVFKDDTATTFKPNLGFPFIHDTISSRRVVLPSSNGLLSFELSLRNISKCGDFISESFIFTFSLNDVAGLIELFPLEFNHFTLFELYGMFHI